MKSNQKFPPPDIEPHELRQIVRVAKLYYDFDLTQNQIAERLGLSRVKIHRLLNTAKEVGVVKIKIDAEDSGFLDIENSLVKTFNLRDALVVPSQTNQEDLYLALGKGSSEWLIPKLKPGIRVGLGLGRTISHLPKIFSPNQRVDCIFTEVVGGASDHSGGFSSYNVTSKMAELTGGRAEFFYAPTYVSSPELKLELLKEPSIMRALENARQCDIVMQSVGPVDETALLYQHKFISKQDLDEFKQTGAVGDALGHFFNQNGEELPAFTGAHMIGLDLADLKKISWSVCIAGGPEKTDVIHAALRGGIFNVLITDVHTAEEFISKEGQK
jgi:DNA-binding transcriptional regulator LsrR (DeoR family)